MAAQAAFILGGSDAILQRLRHQTALLPAKKRKSYFRPQWAGAKGQQTLHMPAWD